MAKKESTLGKVVTFVAWLTGVIVSLSVGFALVDKVLTLPAWMGGATVIGAGIAQTAGWIVILTTLLGAILVIVHKLQ